MTPLARLPLVTDLRDLGAPPRPGLRWSELIHPPGQPALRRLLLTATRPAGRWDGPLGTLSAGWAAHWGGAAAAAAALRRAQRSDWLLQSAVEIAYQQPLIAGSSQPVPAAAPNTPAVQVLFCIDVRSVVFRQPLESASPAVQTRGFVGSFVVGGAQAA